MTQTDNLNPFSVFVETFKEEYERRTVGTQDGAATQVPIVKSVRRELKSVNSDTLKKNFEGGMSFLSDIFHDASTQNIGPLELNEMEVNLEVTAEGKLAFLGASTALNGKTSFRLLFKKDTKSGQTVG